MPVALALLLIMGALAAAAVAGRLRRRARRRYIRLEVIPYRTDEATPDSLLAMFEALHKRVVVRWWARLISGQPSLALEVHLDRGPSGIPCARLAVVCIEGEQSVIAAALRGAYPHARLRPCPGRPGPPPYLARLKKRRAFITRLRVPDGDQPGEPLMDRLLTVMASVGGSVLVQFALTPAPALLDHWSEFLFRRREAPRQAWGDGDDRSASRLRESELRGALDVAHRALFYGDVRVVAADRAAVSRVAGELCAQAAENRLIPRGTSLRQSAAPLYERRLARGEGNPVPDVRRGVFASIELAGLWQLPSVDFSAVPVERHSLARAPASPMIARTRPRAGLLVDDHGPVTIEPALRRQNTAVAGTVEQGKTSYLLASIEEDLARDRCAVIVLDPKGDAADAAVGLVDTARTCTVLDLAHPECGFNPLAVRAPPDAIADGVVHALRGLFAEGDIRASSDRYLRNAIIAALAHDPAATLWEAARLLSVTSEGHAYRRWVSETLASVPEYKEIVEFFADELGVQLLDARGMTTAKLDAPANKLARLLNSPSIKRVLLNNTLTVDLDRVLDHHEVLVVRGALGVMGAENTGVVMQLILAALDAALSRRQDRTDIGSPPAVALKIDEAPLVINAAFARTIALKRSAGLETVACWQTDAQWPEGELREGLDALFAHRVYFATASAEDARRSAALMMAEFSDQVRSGSGGPSALARPDARLHLPRHWAIASWTTSAGRQPPFIARTRPLRLDRSRLAHHRARQRERGGRYLADLRQPHWDPEAGHQPSEAAPAPAPNGRAAPPSPVWRELAALDGSTSVRHPSRPGPTAPPRPDELDHQVLAWLSGIGFALTGQLGRRFAPGSAPTTIQRRLKRLWSAGLLERCQFYGSDGSAVPMVHWITASGLELAGAPAGVRPPAPPVSVSWPAAQEMAVRRGLHAGAWLEALEATLPMRTSWLRGAHRARVEPPRSRAGAGTLAAAELVLPGGRRPHGFRRHLSAGGHRLVERMSALQPAGACQLTWRARGVRMTRELFLELHPRFSAPVSVEILERYDHFLTGWSACLERYRDRPPLVVFACADLDAARDLCRAADRILTAARSYAGEQAQLWPRPGRAGMLFCAESALHRGDASALRVPRLPGQLRERASADPELVDLGHVVMAQPDAG